MCASRILSWIFKMPLFWKALSTPLRFTVRIMTFWAHELGFFFCTVGTHWSLAPWDMAAPLVVRSVELDRCCARRKYVCTQIVITATHGAHRRTRKSRCLSVFYRLTLTDRFWRTCFRTAEKWAMAACRVYRWWRRAQCDTTARWAWTRSRCRVFNRRGKLCPNSRYIRIWTEWTPVNHISSSSSIRYLPMSYYLFVKSDGGVCPIVYNFKIDIAYR